ncbi:hypothetical protein JQ617_32875 [Bradyrhizobium sp. KB893862 SZCCT0404]|uniref:hypothetical protein n=1 Tax=Bradyrhizobium sp. KB893862 SZCCT0404 TaxID=2807672 RepID=UPI001BA8238C|nr:hypothetical protein [Bradyrhizobium sp. KB893862 SZCCT0404]MBR1178800.1 hypothetical protein [Bradyrhizobium sp. KB893862 SZCCT0404]
MMKSVLAASAVLVALCSAASAREVHHPYVASESAAGMSQVHPGSMGYAAMSEDAGYDAHQYHGGPKVND